MKYLALLILCCLVSIGLCLELDTNYYDGGKIQQRFFVKKRRSVDEIKDSLFVEYYESGKKKTEMYYKSDVEDGPINTWYEDGSKEMKGYYTDGVLDDTISYWYAGGGRLKSRAIYSAGAQVDTSFAWYEDGTLKTMDCFESGKKHGKSQAWYPNGKPRYFLYFARGVPSGVVKSWHPNGELAVEGFYDDEGQKEYLWKVFQSDGNRAAVIEYHLGKVVKKKYYVADANIDNIFLTIESK